MTATKMTNYLTKEELSVLFYDLTELIREVWGTKKGKGLFPERFSRSALFNRVDEVTPRVFANEWRFNHIVSGGKSRKDGIESEKPCPDENEVIALLKWVYHFGIDYFPEIAVLLDDPKYLRIRTKVQPNDRSAVDQLTLALERLTMEVFEKEQKVLNLQHTIGRSEMQKIIAETEAERLKSEIEAKAEQYRHLAQEILSKLEGIESTTENEDVKSELAAIRQQVDFLTS